MAHHGWLAGLLAGLVTGVGIDVAAVASIVTRCLAKQREDRWARAADLRAALDELQATIPTAA